MIAPGVMNRERRGGSRAARHVVIVGGGISGLSAAWFLERCAAGLGVGYTVIESSGRWGGRIFSECVDGPGPAPFVVEAGPDAFLTQKPWALELAHELGLSERLIGMNDAGAVYVLDRGRPVAMPDGVLLVAPTRFLPFLRSPLITFPGKLRMGMDLVIPPRRDDCDETLAAFVRRRLGREALDKIAEPLMAGIYNADAEAQSIMATFPRFRELERTHGSVIRGMVRSRPRRSKAGSGPANAAKVPMFMSLKDGTQELVDALVPRLGGDLRLNTRVRSLDRGSGERYRVVTDRGDVIDADAVVVTTPAYTAADLVRVLSPGAADRLSEIGYVSTGTMSLGFRAADVTRPLRGVGLVVPAAERRPINAITVSSAKFEHRAPDGCVLLRVFYGGSRSPETMRHDDATLLGAVRGELRDILGVESAPLFHKIYRFHRANPQYAVGHLDRVAEIEAALPRGLFVTGAAYRGVGLPDCVYQARCTVDRLVDPFRQTQTTHAEVTA